MNYSTIFFYGTIWGIIEATLGAFLHTIHHPLKGPIMFSVGVMVMGAGLGMSKPGNPFRFLLGVGVVAAAFKGFDVLLPGPFMTPLVVARPMIAILLEALSFGVFVSYVGSRMRSPSKSTAVAGLISPYLGYSLLAVFFTGFGLGSKFWLGKSASELAGIVLSDGSKAALLCAFSSVVGFEAGSLADALAVRARTLRFFRPAVALALLLCWSGVLL